MNLTEAFARPRVEVDQITGELKEMFADHSFSGSEKIGLAVFRGCSRPDCEPQRRKGDIRLYLSPRRR
jgi:hypothetical protein